MFQLAMWAVIVPHPLHQTQRCPILTDASGCPPRFVNTSVVFKIDPIAAVSALVKGRSTSDELATTIKRAARLLAALLGCRMASEWIPRRSKWGSIVADDQTPVLWRVALILDKMCGVLHWPHPQLDGQPCRGPHPGQEMCTLDVREVPWNWNIVMEYSHGI